MQEEPWEVRRPGKLTGVRARGGQRHWAACRCGWRWTAMLSPAAEGQSRRASEPTVAEQPEEEEGSREAEEEASQTGSACLLSLPEHHERDSSELLLMTLLAGPRSLAVAPSRSQR
eukprot:565444-Rhodomonas_salina.4